MLGALCWALHELYHFILEKTPQSRYPSFHFTDEGTEIIEIKYVVLEPEELFLLQYNVPPWRNLWVCCTHSSTANWKELIDCWVIWHANLPPANNRSIPQAWNYADLPVRSLSNLSLSSHRTETVNPEQTLGTQIFTRLPNDLNLYCRNCWLSFYLQHSGSHSP